MSRFFLSLATVLGLASAAQASLHSFIPSGTTQGNVLTLVGSGDFELADTPNAQGFYPAITPFSVEVTGDVVGAVQYSLTLGAVIQDKVILQFNHPTYNKLFMPFDVAGATAGDPFPASVIDDDGLIGWVAEGLAAPSSPSLTLAGFVGGEVAAVPEPSSFAMAGIAIGLIGFGRTARRRLRRQA